MTLFKDSGPPHGRSLPQNQDSTCIVQVPAFNYENFGTGALLEKFLKRFQSENRPISVNFRALVGCLQSAERATHLIHPYPAKLLPHIPFFFLANDIFSKPGDNVLDPFCGSGTVLLEAMLAGRPSIGVDLNPIARLISEVKTTPMCIDSLRAEAFKLLERIPSYVDEPEPDVVNLNHWFHPHVISKLKRIRKAISTTAMPSTRDFFSMCFSSCLRKVSLADPRLSVPVRLRYGQYPVDHPFREKTDAHMRRLARINVFHVFSDVILANVKRMATLEPVLEKLPSALVLRADARHLDHCNKSDGSATHSILDNSIQLVITSPPYPGAQKYVRSSELSLGWLGLCSVTELRPLKGSIIGREEFTKAEFDIAATTGVPAADAVVKRIRGKNPIRAAIAATYLTEMTTVLQEIYRVLKPGGHMVLVAANNSICRMPFYTQRYLRCLAEQMGFNLKLILVDDIRSRGLMTKRNTTASIIAREWVMVFSKGVTHDR